MCIAVTDNSREPTSNTKESQESALYWGFPPEGNHDSNLFSIYRYPETALEVC